MIISCTGTTENLKAAFTGKSMTRNRSAFCLKLAFPGIVKESGEHSIVNNSKESTFFTKEKSIVWVCRTCGHIHIGISAPMICPVCRRSYGYSEVKAVNYG